MQKVMNGEVQIILGNYYLREMRARFMSHTQVCTINIMLSFKLNFYLQHHFINPTVIVIPPGEPYGPFERLFRPFQAPVWHYLIATLILGNLSILLIKLLSERFRHFIFGRLVQSPFSNFFLIMLGSSLHQLPGRNFARYILAGFGNV